MYNISQDSHTANITEQKFELANTARTTSPSGQCDDYKQKMLHGRHYKLNLFVLSFRSLLKEGKDIVLITFFFFSLRMLATNNIPAYELLHVWKQG